MVSCTGGRGLGPGVAALLATCSLLGCAAANPEFERGDDRLPVEPGQGLDGPWPGVDVAAVPDARPAVDAVTMTTPGLVGYWRFEEGGGTVARDSSGMGHDGMLENMGSAPWVAGDSGTGGLRFPGTSNAAVRIRATPAIDAIRTFTIAAWIKRGWQGGANDHHSVLSRQLGGSNDELFNLSCQLADAVVYIPRSQGRIVQARAPLTVAADDWLHLAGTYDGNRLLIYQNGAEIARTTGLDVQLAASSTDLLIGLNQNSTLSNEPFLGVMDEVVVFSVALTAQGIRTLAQRGSPSQAAAASNL